MVANAGCGVRLILADAGFVLHQTSVGLYRAVGFSGLPTCNHRSGTICSGAQHIVLCSVVTAVTANGFNQDVRGSIGKVRCFELVAFGWHHQAQAAVRSSLAVAHSLIVIQNWLSGLGIITSD